MNIFALFLLALALCIDSFIASIAIGLQKGITIKRGLLFSFFCALFQGLFPLIGILLGNFFKTDFDNYDHWIAFAFLFFIGLKMILEARKTSKNQLAFNMSKMSILIGLAVATSIDAFVVGIGLGFELASVQSKINAVCIIGLSTFCLSAIGLFLGRRHKGIPVKFTTLLGGLILIGLGIKILINHNAIPIF